MNQSERIELTAVKRAVRGKQVGQLRRDGWTPAVMYGHSFDAVSLQFETHRLQQLLAHVGSSQLISIRIEGEAQPEMALVRDIQRDPIRHTITHLDLYRVKMTERITAEVPLELVGESPAVESREGILLQGISTIEVECLPGDLVDAIEVDISDLAEIDQGIYVRDLTIPSGMDVLTDADEMVARIVPLEELEEAVVEEAEVIPGEVEVIKESRASDKE
jgi:large subunit ribosomal protein L25